MALQGALLSCVKGVMEKCVWEMSHYLREERENSLIKDSQIRYTSSEAAVPVQSKDGLVQLRHSKDSY